MSVTSLLLLPSYLDKYHKFASPFESYIFFLEDPAIINMQLLQRAATVYTEVKMWDYDKIRWGSGTKCGTVGNYAHDMINLSDYQLSRTW